MEQLLSKSLFAPDLQTTELVTQILRAVRDHLGMPFAFVSEFVEGNRVFRYVDCNRKPPPFRAGDSGPLSESYCLRVIDGRLPPLIRDAAQVPAARELPVTEVFPIGAHLSMPIVLSDGHVFGTFCCFSDRADHSMNPRDLEMMRAFSRVIAQQIERQRDAMGEYDEKLERVRRAMDADQLDIVFQPIRSLVDARVLGFEALSRFSGPVQQPPPLLVCRRACGGAWCGDGDAGDPQRAAVLACLGRRLSVIQRVPPHGAQWNVARYFAGGGAQRRIVLEIPEHAQVNDYAALQRALAPLRRSGVRVAVDDAGAGYATLRHITELQPDLIKLDAHLTRNVEQDAIKRALIKAMTTFAREIGCDLVAEGIETERQRDLLLALGIRNGQGYLFGRPAPMAVVTH